MLHFLLWAFHLFSQHLRTLKNRNRGRVFSPSGNGNSLPALLEQSWLLLFHRTGSPETRQESATEPTFFVLFCSVSSCAGFILILFPPMVSQWLPTALGATFCLVHDQKGEGRTGCSFPEALSKPPPIESHWPKLAHTCLGLSQSLASGMRLA